MNNYRPASNLTFLSKFLEKVVVNQLNSYINSSNTSNKYQSAYRKFHSTETALLKIHNDILASMDAGKVIALTLLDLFIAFDTVDHTILLRRLDDWFEVPRKTLDWFISHLTGRYQRIRLGYCLSSKAHLKFGVPQESGLGPLLFTLYTTPLSSNLWTCHPSPPLCWWQPPVCFLWISGLCFGSEWSTFGRDLSPVMDVDE